MAIHRLLQQAAFMPEDIQLMVTVYEDCLRALNLANQSDPIAEIVAKKVIEIAQTGQRDPAQIRRLVLKDIGVPPQ